MNIMATKKSMKKNLNKKPNTLKSDVKSDLNKKNSKDENSKIYAFIATFLSIIGFIIVILLRRNDKYVMHYAKLSLVVFITAFVGGIAVEILNFIPVLGPIINVAFNILIFISWVVSWVYSLSGEQKEIPIISNWSEKINL